MHVLQAKRAARMQILGVIPDRLRFAAVRAAVAEGTINVRRGYPWGREPVPLERVVTDAEVSAVNKALDEEERLAREWREDERLLERAKKAALRQQRQRPGLVHLDSARHCKAQPVMRAGRRRNGFTLHFWNQQSSLALANGHLDDVLHAIGRMNMKLCGFCGVWKWETGLRALPGSSYSVI